MSNYDIIKEKAILYKREFLNLKRSVEELLLRILEDISKTTDTVPSEKEFLKVIREFLDDIIKLPVLLEPFDGIIIDKVVESIDKNILDRLLGENWYDTLVQKVKSVHSKYSNEFTKKAPKKGYKRIRVL